MRADRKGALQNLKEELLYPKFYWEDRDSKKIFTAWGKSAKKEAVCCGIFPSPFLTEEHFFYPLFSSHQEAEALTPSLDFTCPDACQDFVHTPSQKEWESLVEKALIEITNKQFSKVVLARSTKLQLTDSLDPFAFLKTLKQYKSSVSFFLFSPSPDKAFVGATPEKLYTRKKNVLFSEALAGTLKKGHTLRDFQEKEHQELALVLPFFEEKLPQIATHWEWDKEPHLVPSISVIHLRKKVEAYLKPSFHDLDIMNLLHPTPAIGGYPQKEALQFIAKHEPFSRHFYAAPIGWFSSQEAEIGVTLRAVEIHNSSLTFFAGAGIVKGSEAGKEWEELEAKIAPLTSFWTDKASL